MATASPNLGATAPVSKIDATDWTRELWLEAFAMARRMIRDRAGHGIARRLTLVPEHARKRFGASGWRIAQAAGRAVFDRARSPSPPPAASRTSSARGWSGAPAGRGRGNLTATVPYRCRLVRAAARLRLQHGVEFDPLTSGNNRGLRVHRARKLRAERRQIMAEVRRRNGPSRWAMAEDRFALTLTGLFALQNADRGKA